MSEFFTPERDQRGLSEPDSFNHDLPNALLIGDSISIGYTQGVTHRLQDVCNVRRAPDNCGDTRRGLSDLDKWLGDTRWDLIHFNLGLHDLCYRHPEATAYGNRDKERGTISVPLAEYEANLETIATRLEAAAPTLIFASTTVVPEGEAGRFVGDDIRYNDAAAQVMAKHKIPINDLHALSASFDPDMFTAPGDVHFTDKGSARLAEQVATWINNHLNPAP